MAKIRIRQRSEILLVMFGAMGIYAAALATLFFLWLGCVPATSSEEHSDQIAREFVSLLEGRKFEEIARLFHYPSSYSEEERNNDLEAVAASLAIIFDLFGWSTDVREGRASGNFFLVGVFGGVPRQPFAD